MIGVTYDTGVLIAAERGDQRVWAWHQWTLSQDIIPTVPAVVLAQGWRGGPQPQMSRLLAGCHVEPLDEELARSAGRLCGNTSTSDIVDAAVVAGASARGDLVATSDPADIKRLVEASGVRLVLREI